MTISVVEERVVSVLADRLRTALTHPGDKDKDQPPLAIPMLPFRSMGVHPGLVDEFSRQAGLPPEQQVTRLVAEAVVHTIQSEGAATIVDNGELERLRAGDAQPGERVTVLCRACGQPLLTLRVKGNQSVVDGRLLAQAGTGCPHR